MVNIISFLFSLFNSPIPLLTVLAPALLLQWSGGILWPLRGA